MWLEAFEQPARSMRKLPSSIAVAGGSISEYFITLKDQQCACLLIAGDMNVSHRAVPADGAAALMECPNMVSSTQDPTNKKRAATTPLEADDSHKSLRLKAEPSGK